jgi:hypothetical protein
LEDVARDLGVSEENVVGGNNRIVFGGAHDGQMGEWDKV